MYIIASDVFLVLPRKDRYDNFCVASSDEDEVAALLIEAGANVNSTNNKDVTPLIIAAVKGHISVLRILVTHPAIKLSDQVRVSI